MSKEQKTSISFLLDLARLKLDEVNENGDFLNKIYEKRHFLKSIGVDIYINGTPITQFDFYNGRNKNQ